MRFVAFAAALGACGSPRATEPPRNTLPATSAVRVAPTDPLGWIGLATAETADSELPDHVPVSARFRLVVPTADGLVAGTKLSAIGMRGGVVAVTAGTPIQVPFGCDDHQLDAIGFAAPRLPPGPVWILPPGFPASWAPAALAIEPRITTATRRTFAIGPLALQLGLGPPSKGTLEIVRGGQTVFTEPFSRELMDGADPADAKIDLTVGGPGVPTPIAAWSFAPSGPLLLVFELPGWEGVTLRTLLVDDVRAHPLDGLAQYLYRCAF